MKRVIELRNEGETLSGVILQEGRAAQFRREMFTLGAIEWPESGIDILPRHLAPSGTGVKAIPTRNTDGRIGIAVRASETLRQAYAEGRRFLSVEFHALNELTTAGGIREIRRALVLAAALVDKPEYAQATAELRQRGGRTLRATIPSGADVECACTGAGCNFVNFSQDLMQDMFDRTFTQFQREAVGTYGSYNTALGSVSRGTVRGRVLPNGDGQVDIDLPDSAAGAAVIDAHESSGVIVRPFVDPDVSGGTSVIRPDGVEVLQYDRAEIRAFIASNTDARRGWPESEIIATPQEFLGENRQARRKRRRLFV